MFLADSQENQYQFNLFVNATSQASVPYFSQYMYESILSNAKSSISFTVKTSPFPIFFVFESRVASG